MRSSVPSGIMITMLLINPLAYGKGRGLARMVAAVKWGGKTL